MAIVALSKKRKEIVVAFRGTWNVWNVVLDALLICGRTSNTPRQIKIHQGFYMATMSLYDDVSMSKGNNGLRRREFIVLNIYSGGSNSGIVFK